MLGTAAPYVVAICSLLFCGACALTLFTVVDHFDPPGSPATDDLTPAATTLAKAG